jgi:hypothetical protein
MTFQRLKNLEESESKRKNQEKGKNQIIEKQITSNVRFR